MIVVLQEPDQPRIAVIRPRAVAGRDRRRHLIAPRSLSDEPARLQRHEAAAKELVCRSAQLRAPGLELLVELDIQIHALERQRGVRAQRVQEDFEPAEAVVKPVVLGVGIPTVLRDEDAHDQIETAVARRDERLLRRQVAGARRRHLAHVATWCNCSACGRGWGVHHTTTVSDRGSTCAGATATTLVQHRWIQFSYIPYFSSSAYTGLVGKRE